VAVSGAVEAVVVASEIVIVSYSLCVRAVYYYISLYHFLESLHQKHCTQHIHCCCSYCHYPFKK